MSKYLVNAPAAVEFLDSVHLDSGLNVLLGETSKVEPMVAPEFQSARIELRAAVQKVEGLAQDPTRTDVQRHHAAKKVADGVAEKLGKTKVLLEKRADQLESDSFRQADELLGPKADRAALDTEIRDWIYDQTHKPEGLEKIRKALEGSDDLARVLWYSPRFLLNLPQETHEVLRYEALQSRRPDLYGNLAASMHLKSTVAKVDATIRKVRSSFYSPALASQASKRVEVGP